MKQSKAQGSTREAWKLDDDWSKVREREERKKRQNRLNQRAYRRRKEPKEPTPGKDRPFRVERFRVMEISPSVVQIEPASHTEQLPMTGEANLNEVTACSLAVLQSVSRDSIDSTTLAGNSSLTTFPDAALQSKDPRKSNRITSLLYLPHMFSQSTKFVPDDQNPGGAPTCTSFPLSSDHLIHLIHFNVFRALLTNKSILNNAAILTNTEHILIPPFPYQLCAGLTLIHPKATEPLPQSLIPTLTQMTLPHTSWLNMFPYPQLRDNLIFHQNEFSHMDLCNDLWGEFFFWNISGFESSYAVCPPSSMGTENGDCLESGDDDCASRKQGLIVWGESWDLNGWEVTDGFVRKWSWLLEGCIDLFVSTNFWRAKRDLEPLEYPFLRIVEEEV